METTTELQNRFLLQQLEAHKRAIIELEIQLARTQKIVQELREELYYE